MKANCTLHKAYLIVQNVDEVCIEWMNVFKLGELEKNLGQFLGEVAACELDFAHIK